MKVGIIGAGHIAEKMSATLQKMPQHQCYAVGSRSLEKARSFAAAWGFEKAYGSYLELVKDPEVDLVYVATPHSCHFEQVKMAVEHGKPVLCEKTFMMNAREAEEVFALSESRGVFVTEAIWTRYEPFMATIRDLVRDGAVGEPSLLYASLSYPVTHKERVMAPELGGGALMDVGVYALNFARMVFGGDISSVRSHAVMSPRGVDLQNSISLVYGDGRMANLQSSVLCANGRQGIISGSTGYLVVDNINNPLHADLYSKDHVLVKSFDAPPQITGFEYQVEACADALRHGWIESPFMPHAESIALMRMMDTLLAEWRG